MDDDDDGDAPTLTILSDVKILRVEFVTRAFEWVQPIVEKHHHELFPVQNSQTQSTFKWTYEKSLRIFRGQSVYGNDRSSGSSEAVEEDPPDIDNVLSSSSLEAENSDLVHDQVSEKQFKSLRSLVGVPAQCLVEYTPVRVGYQVDKRAKTLSRQTAYVLGEWPVLSNAVRFLIAAKPFASDTKQTTITAAPLRFDAMQRGCYVAPYPSTHARVADFYSMLKHTCRMHENHVNSVIRSLFPAIYSDGLPTVANDRCVHLTLKGPDGAASLSTAKPLDNTFAVSELRDVIERSSIISWLTIDSNKPFFQVVPMFFYGVELNRIVMSYQAKKCWFDILARGRAFIMLVDYLLCHSPHTLSIKRLKFVECLKRQKDIKIQKAKLLKTSANPPRSALAQFDADCAAMRGLLALPERTFNSYRETLAANVAAGFQSVLEPAEQPIVVTALDIYAMMQHDLAANDDLYANKTHADRVKASEHGATSGHMFTVIDSTPRSAIIGCDTSCSLGMATLDDVIPQVVAPPPPPTQEDSLWEDDVHSTTLTLPLLPRPTAVSTASTSTTSTARPENVRHFSDPIKRLAISCSAQQFVDGMHWLLDNVVVTRVKMRGTGPHNRGREFDAFYLTTVYNAQNKCVAVLKDMYDRGIADAIRRKAERSAADYNLEATVEAHEEKVALFREKCAFLSRARDFNRQLAKEHAFMMSRSKNESLDPAADLMAVDAAQSEVVAQPSQVLAMAVGLLNQVKSFVAGQSEPPVVDDPYNDLTPIPQPDERQMCFGLLQNPAPIDFASDEVELCDEQVQAVLRGSVSPISCITGRAGCGKTEVLKKIVKQFPPEQILTTAFTGKVVSELTRRVSSASTVHSILYRDMLNKQEIRRVESILTALKTRARMLGKEEGEMAKIIEARIELYRLLGVSDHQSPFENIRVLVIDEGSLMPFTLFEALMSAVHDYQNRTGRYLCRLIVCGDPWQLYPIGFGSVLPDLIRAFPWCVHHMTINHRSEGTAIFKLANNIALQKFGTRGCPFPTFGGRPNEGRLMNPTRPVLIGTETQDEIERARTSANDASVVFIPANWASLGATIMKVLGLLGCFTDPRSEAATELRNSILMIASTRSTVARLNNICRSLFFQNAIESLGGEMQLSSTGELMMPPIFHQRILIDDRIILKKNRRIIHYVDTAPDQAVAADDEGASVGVMGYRTRRVIDLEEAAVRLQLQSDSRRRVVNSYYNGELLQVVQFYDTPRVITDRVLCRCGLCPKPNEDDDNPQRNECVLRPYDVPARRRSAANLNDNFTIRFHSQNTRYANGHMEHSEHDKRRMVVLRVVNEPEKFKEVDVCAHLANQSQYAFVQAATVHVIQGSEAPIVFFVVTSDNMHVDWSAVYTACTRARYRLVIVGDPSAFQRMVQRQPPIRRSDFWALLAMEARTVHRKYHIEGDHWRLAHALAMPYDELTRALVDTRLTPDGMTRRDWWDLYEPIRAAAMTRGERVE